MHADSGTSSGLPKARFQQHAHNKISGSNQDSLHGLARRLLRPTALEVATDIHVQAANRERGHYIQVRHVYLWSVSSLSISCVILLNAWLVSLHSWIIAEFVCWIAKFIFVTLLREWNFIQIKKNIYKYIKLQLRDTALCFLWIEMRV